MAVGSLLLFTAVVHCVDVVKCLLDLDSYREVELFLLPCILLATRIHDGSGNRNVDVADHGRRC